MLSAIRQTIERFGMVHPDARILVGVSGGADSTCLSLILKELGYKIALAHVNHGLRGEDSDRDETFVADLARQLSVAFYSQKVDIGSAGGNLEAAGRVARQEFFEEILRLHHFDHVALAHNRDDRVETFMMNLLRGAGTDGLTSMEPVSGRVIRPLIETSRPEIESFLQSRSQTWREDASNRDTRFVRNRLRHEVIPALSEAFNVNLPQTLSRSIQILHDENEWLAALADEWLTAHGTKQSEKFVINADDLVSKPVALQRRVLRESLKRAGSTLENVSFDHVESMRSLLNPGQSGKRVEVPGYLTVSRSFGQLVVGRPVLALAEFDYELRIPGEIHIPELSRRFSARFVNGEAANLRADQVFVDGGSLGPYVRIRNWKPGDYYKPLGLPGSKLKKLFQRARIPISERHRMPVFVGDAHPVRIVWVPSFPVSRDFAPRGGSQRIVAFEALSG